MPPAASPASDAAPRWHTAALVALIVVVSVTGLLLARDQPAPTVTESPPGGRAVAYFSSIVVNWALVEYVARVGRARNHLRELLGRISVSLREVAADLGLATALWLLIESGESLAQRALGAPAGTESLLPFTSLERVEWVAFAVSAGVCEEVVYRGYLREALAAWLGRPGLAIVVQAALFGLAHANQGAWAALRIGVYGLALGVVAKHRGSLVPGILAHVAIDLASGLASR